MKIEHRHPEFAVASPIAKKTAKHPLCHKMAEARNDIMTRRKKSERSKRRRTANVI